MNPAINHPGLKPMLIYTVTVQFSVSYTSYHYQVKPERITRIERRKHLIRFKQLPDSEGFVFDQKRSQLSEKEMHDIYDIPL